MKLYLIAAAALLVPVSAFAAKPCEELKTEIATKMEANGVKSYSLEILEKDKDAEGKVVGTCEGGAKKIVYRREAPSQQTPVVDASKKEAKAH